MTALRDAIDYTTLGWVKPEFDETLRQARIETERLAKAPCNGVSVRICTFGLNRLQRTLQDVGSIAAQTNV